MLRYWKSAGKASDHFYTIDESMYARQNGYKQERVAFILLNDKVRCSVPLFRYYLNTGSIRDHFYTTVITEIGTTTPGKIGKHGYKSEGILGYCFREKQKGTVPLYRYYNPDLFDHFYTTSINEIGTAVHGRKGRYGYISEGVVCYVLPW